MNSSQDDKAVIRTSLIARRDHCIKRMDDPGSWIPNTRWVERLWALDRAYRNLGIHDRVPGLPHGEHPYDYGYSES